MTINKIKKCGFCGAENSIENNLCIKCKQKLYAVNVIEKNREDKNMELLMPGEELRDIKKKVVFWFWCGLISYCTFWLMNVYNPSLQVYLISIGIGQDFAYLLYKLINFLAGIFSLLFFYSLIMFLIRLSKYFIEKEN